MMMIMKVIPVERIVQELLAGILRRDNEEEVGKNLAVDIDLVPDLKIDAVFLQGDAIYQIRTFRAMTNTIADVVVVELKNHRSTKAGTAKNIVDRRDLRRRRAVDLAIVTIIRLVLAILNLVSETRKGEVVAVVIPVTVMAMNLGTQNVDENTLMPLVVAVVVRMTPQDGVIVADTIVVRQRQDVHPLCAIAIAGLEVQEILVNKKLEMITQLTTTH